MSVVALCVQDYRPGKVGFQQHIWQATLGPGTMVFAFHPGPSARHWLGRLPRAPKRVFVTHGEPSAAPIAAPIRHILARHRRTRIGTGRVQSQFRQAQPAGREDEAEDRKFFIAAFRYGRTLAANNSLALQYTIDAVPVAIATGTIVSRTTSLTGIETFQRETAYGAGLTPIGLQLDFANGAKVHPFVHVNGGFLYFSKEVPIEDSGQFAFVGEAGGGVRVFTSERRAVNIGVRFHHISNGDRSGSNRGLNQFVIYAGFSIFQ